MEKKISGLISRPLYPYLYCFAFLCYKTARYLPSFKLPIALAGLLLLVAVCWVFNFFLKKISYSSYHGITVMILMTSLLHVAGIAQLAGHNYSYVPDSFYILFYSITLGVIVLAEFAGRKVSQRFATRINPSFNVFLLIVSVVFIVQAAMTGSWQKRYSRAHRLAAQRPADASRKKDIVWLLFDEYASSASLRHQFHFENTLDSQLTHRGFAVLPNMKSRFNNTLFSLNAIFNEDDSTTPASFYEGVRSLKESSWDSSLEANGYRFVNLGLFNIGNHRQLSDRSGYPQTYLQQLMTGTIFNVIIAKKKFTVAECDKYDLEVLRMLGDSLHVQDNYPRLIWAHISIPHEPFRRNKHGHLLDRGVLDESDSVSVKKEYIEYLQYGNTVLLNLLDQHPELAGKIVIMSGDHGPRFRFFNEKQYQYWPFAAAYFPSAYDTAALRNLRYISQLPDFILRYVAKQ